MATALARGREELGETLESAILAEVPEFSSGRDRRDTTTLADHLGDHLDEIHRLIGGARTPKLEFVRRHAARRAEERFPLEAVLRACRVAQRVGVPALQALAATRIAAPGERDRAIADFAVGYVDAVTTLVTSEYVRRTRQLSAADADSRSRLLGILLHGYDGDDTRVVRLLGSAGYLDRRLACCVVLVRSLDPAEMNNAARANRLLAAVRKAFEDFPGRVLFGFHEQRVVAVVAANRRVSGWTAPREALAGKVGWPLLELGNAVVAGVSAEAASCDLVPRALAEAELALDIADASQRVVEYASIPLKRLLLHLAAERIQSALPAWSAALLDADARAGGVLVATLRAYADADMNVLKTASRLGVHPNTVYARMHRIRDLTAQDPLRYHKLSELLLAVDCSPPGRSAGLEASSR